MKISYCDVGMSYNFARYLNNTQEINCHISECWQTNQWKEPILSWGHKGGVAQANDVKPPGVDYYWSKIELIKVSMNHTKYRLQVEKERKKEAEKRRQ